MQNADVKQLNIDEAGRLLNPLIWPVLHLTILLSKSSYFLGETVSIIDPILMSPEPNVKGRPQTC